MKDEAPSLWQSTGVALLAAVLFIAAYGQAPLYYSNQNQYFLHGLARAEKGLLAEDWLANTADPTPVFSTLVAFTARYLDPVLFFVYHALLLGLYTVAMLGLFERVVTPAGAVQRWRYFLVGFLLLHAAAARWCSYRVLGQDYPWYFQSGVAGQYVLGAMLQPSVFGVLLVLAICLFVRERPYAATVALAASATIHTTYLLPAALLTLGFMTTLIHEGRYRQAAQVAGLALAQVVPVLLYSWLTFAPTSPEAFAEAQEILVNVRIPHHARVDLWFDWVAGLQIAWMVLAVGLAWRTRLFAVLGVPLVLASLLTLMQFLTRNNTLALLFPWRMSSVLMPVATTVILARATTWLPDRFLDRFATPLARSSECVLLGLAGVGIWISLGQHAFYMAPEEEAVMAAVRDRKQSGDVYLLPVRVPDLAATTRGSLSSDFKPLAEKREGVRVIPVDLQRFRLHSEAPIFVDFKSIPYRDTEVIEWRERLRFAQQIQERLKKGEIDVAVAELRGRRVTHLVLPAAQRIEHPALQPLPDKDAAYRVYKLQTPAQKPD